MAALSLQTFFGIGHEQPNFRFNFDLELRDFFLKRQHQLGFSNAELAEHFVICSSGCALRAIERFYRDGRIKDSFRLRLQQLLCISDLALEHFSQGFYSRAFAGRNCFFEHFSLFMDHAEEIINTRAYANVVFYGLQAKMSLLNRPRPLTLGELLSYYRRGQWIVKSPSGDPAYLYHIEGSPMFTLWGDAIEPVKHRLIRLALSQAREFVDLYMHYEAPFEFQNSAWTVQSLAGHLQSA